MLEHLEHSWVGARPWVRRFFRWLYTAKPLSPDFPIPVCQIVLILCTAWGPMCILTGLNECRVERYYDAEGVLTDSGVIVARWSETREEAEGSMVTHTFVRYRCVDQEGRTYEHVHHHVGRLPKLTWDQLQPGSRMPTIEYLAADPGTHRPASNRGGGPWLIRVGLFLLAVILPFRVLYGLATWRVQPPPWGVK